MSLVKTTYHHVSRGTGKILGIESLLRRKSEIDGAFDRFQFAGIRDNHCRGNSLPSTVISAMKTKKLRYTDGDVLCLVLAQRTIY